MVPKPTADLQLFDPAERMAIMEYCGGLSREDAERAARRDAMIRAQLLDRMGARDGARASIARERSSGDVVIRLEGRELARGRTAQDAIEGLRASR
jgi:hypothetical protein